MGDPSGYSAGLAEKDVAVLEEQTFLPKPLCPTKLLEILRCCLDGSAN